MKIFTVDSFQYNSSATRGWERSLQLVSYKRPSKRLTLCKPKLFWSASTTICVIQADRSRARRPIKLLLGTLPADCNQARRQITHSATKQAVVQEWWSGTMREWLQTEKRSVCECDWPRKLRSTEDAVWWSHVLGKVQRHKAHTLLKVSSIPRC